ncbi:hypothetical protein HK097_010218 [Rhizophlyctis rosea]|uniref:Uncharacterized protein n=1 Tax=Rhizophlyctis rosea TaxID=64517 RepID=A0AAD5SJ06_9FUNG|nr:hypothetical protein HK097_010218 [Rhizophlyctis rosea]
MSVYHHTIRPIYHAVCRVATFLAPHIQYLLALTYHYLYTFTIFCWTGLLATIPLLQRTITHSITVFQLYILSPLKHHLTNLVEKAETFSLHILTTSATVLVNNIIPSLARMTSTSFAHLATAYTAIKNHLIPFIHTHILPHLASFITYLITKLSDLLPFIPPLLDFIATFLGSIPGAVEWAFVVVFAVLKDVIVYLRDVCDPLVRRLEIIGRWLSAGWEVLKAIGAFLAAWCGVVLEIGQRWGGEVVTMGTVIAGHVYGFITQVLKEVEEGGKRVVWWVWDSMDDMEGWANGVLGKGFGKGGLLVKTE